MAQAAASAEAPLPTLVVVVAATGLKMLVRHTRVERVAQAVEAREVALLPLRREA